jgi:ankyrin repeat protein
VKTLIAHGADTGCDLNTAAWLGNTKAIHALLKRGVKVDSLGANKETPLMWAVESGQVAASRLLISRGASLKAGMRDSGHTLLTVAAEAGNSDMVKLLLKSGANPREAGRYGIAPIHCAANPAVAALLLDAGAQLTDGQDFGWAPLDSAAADGNLELVKFLVARGADVRARNKRGETALHSAASYNSPGYDWAVDISAKLPPVIEYLISKGADVNAASNSGETALHAAAMSGHLGNVKTLIKHGAKVNARMKDGRTPLHMSTINGASDVAEYLIAKGADVNAVDKDGITPLRLALQKQTDETAEVIRKHGGTMDGKPAVKR